MTSLDVFEYIAGVTSIGDEHNSRLILVLGPYLAAHAKSLPIGMISHHGSLA